MDTLEEKFKRELNRKLTGGTQAVCWMGMGGVAFFIPADYLLVPEYFTLFLPIRIAFICLCAVAYFLAPRARAPWLSLLPFVVIASAAAMIILFMHFMGGLGEIYYRGLIMSIFAAALALPWRTRYTITLGVFVTAIFAIASPGHESPDSNFIVDIFFLLASTGFAAVWTRISFGFRRTEFINTERIRESNLKLEEMDRLKTNFVANISHELRTPLTLILTPLETLLRNEPDTVSPMLGRVLQGMQRNGVRLLRLLNQLLDFSRLEAGVEKLRVERLDLGRMLDELEEGMSAAAAAGEKKLRVIRPADPAWVFADADKLEKILGNLASNALKFTEPGGNISVRLSSEGDEWALAVQDDGVGIPGAQLNSVFHRFTQVDGSTARGFEGTGIGLALVHEFVEMHGGRITLKSSTNEAARGSAFTVFLKKGFDHFADRPDVTRLENENKKNDGFEFGETFAGFDKGEKKSETPIVEPANLVSSKTTVLIVEDNRDLREFLRELIAPHHNALMATNGHEALVALEKSAADLVLTDIMMPEMDGYELTRRIKNSPKHGNLPVLMLTAKAEMAHKLDGLETGADDYLVKPFDSRELLARIQILLELTRYRRFTEERNRIIEDELDTARMLQEKLLPEHLPVSPDFDVHAVYQPMDKIGGDLYDVFSLGPNRLGIFVADVTGHGVPGALLGAVVKTALEHAYREARSPADILSYLNGRVLRRTLTAYFVTAVLADIDLEARRITVAHAGHERLLIHHADGRLEETEGEGLPLGIMEDTNFLQVVHSFKPGARLIFQSDGITDTENPAGKMYGLRRFHDFIQKQGDGRSRSNAVQFADQLMRDLKRFRDGKELRDDLTLVIADLLPARENADGEQAGEDAESVTRPRL